MRIIKGDLGSTAFRTVAGEMYNIEMSVLKYIDGVAVEPVEVGYPRLVVDDIEYTFHAVAGYIFVNDICNLEIVLDGVVEALAQLPTIRHRATTILAGVHTNVKAQCKYTNTRTVATRHCGWAGRQISIAGAMVAVSNGKARFKWTIVPIAERRHYDAAGYGTLVGQLFSIYLDTNDLCSLAHNSIVYDFAPDKMRFNINEETTPSLTLILSESTQPQIKALYKFYAQHYVDIPCDVQIWQSSAMPSRTCHVCKTIVFDDVYLVSRTEEPPYMTICVLCMHANRRPFKHLFEKYTFIQRTRSHVTAADRINDMASRGVLSSEQTDIMLEMTKAIRRQEVGDIETYFIGDKYIGALPFRALTYGPVMTEPRNRMRQVIVVREA